MAKTTSVSVIPVKLCYSHIGGRLGNLLAQLCIENGWVKQTEGSERLFTITPKGKKAFTDLGIDLTLIPEESI